MIGADKVRAVAGVGASCLLVATGTTYVVFSGLSWAQGQLERFSWGPSIAAKIVEAQRTSIEEALDAERQKAARAVLEAQLAKALSRESLPEVESKRMWWNR